ncbi:MAG: metal-dependent hydrolase, partial [Candidatus Altiarchaeales archaeon]|nr:metal-dependent hydrolase [Candidatus Altiarchaeales archaeon]
MIFEHWIYSAAFAVVFGLFYYRLTGRDYGWIIVASAYAPDIDFVAGSVLGKVGVTVLFHGSPIEHGDFHNIAFMFLYGVFVGFLLRGAGIRFLDSFIFASVGFAAHMFEDALVFNPAYCFLWPFSSQEFGLGLLPYSPDLYGIADTQVLLIGLFMVALCV